MSFDPFAAGSEPPPEYGPAPLPPGGPSEYARQRVQAPAIALIVSGILNLLTALIQVGGTVFIAVVPPGEPQRMMIQALPPEFAKAMQEQMEQAKADPQTEKIKSVVSNTIVSILMVIVSVLTLLGGMRMLSLRSYALSIAGAVSAAVPCISCGGLCCFGEIIGIWALIVLLNVEVRAAFPS